jgi:DNA helicase IV
MYWWRSSGPGALFTGVTSWSAEINDKHQFVVLEGWLKPVVTVHLCQLLHVEIKQGVNWAACEFHYLENGTRQTYKTDGIPNEHAATMQTDLHAAIATELADVVDGKAIELDAWLKQVSMRVRKEPGVIVTSDAIQAAIASAPPLASPGNVPWSFLLLRHPLAGQARAKQKKWPAWKAPPEMLLASQAQEHNLATYASALESWNHQIAKAMGTDRWVPKNLPATLLHKFPPPQLPNRSWHEDTGDTTPIKTLTRIAQAQNEAHLANKMVEAKHFFDTVEKNSLTEEQIRACICMDESVLVVAAAGSGKTSTMVAKTGYILAEGLAKPDQILLLAFNRAAADEVGERIAERLKGVPNIDKVRSNTFHAFGIDVIAKATGKKPSLAPWVAPDNPGADVRQVSEIIEALSGQDSNFKREWDLFRSIYASDIGKWGEDAEPDTYEGGKRGFLTARGDVVRSKEERQIANWLFYHHVNYEYERQYEHDTATESRRQYFPDFYYPDIELYHEHFALNEHGDPPPKFRGYMEGVLWKRKIHAEKGTELVETLSHGIYSGKAFEDLARELTSRGITLNFDPDRNSLGQEPIPAKDLARSIRVFQQHVKNNGLSSAQLHEALTKQSKDGHAARLRLYLSLYERISAEWERRLREGRYVDFEDMLIQAVDHVESGRYESPYTVILGDEFQDSSRARIRLLSALTKNPGESTHLLVVGDDWQGINRFAGSDISVMTEFEKSFPGATQMELSTTFRCPQELCDASSEFVQANPVQLRKTVRTTNPLKKTPMLAFAFKHKFGMTAHVADRLSEMYRYAREGKLKPEKGPHIIIMILGRYRSDEPAKIGIWQKQYGDHLKISFKTVHGSKGLEAEYVFVLNVIQDSHGFPSQIQDDPALQLAMPAPDVFPYAEERRLFYVAMTRARKQVRFYTLSSKPSQFLVELSSNKKLSIQSVDGEMLTTPCPQCGAGFLNLRQSNRGPFYGCSRFPGCDYTEELSISEKRSLTPSKPASVRIMHPVKEGDPCPVCRRGILTRRSGKNGAFLGCSHYPKCTITANLNQGGKPQ